MILELDLVNSKFTLGKCFDLSIIVLFHVCILNILLNGLVTLNDELSALLFGLKLYDVCINFFNLEHHFSCSCELKTPFYEWLVRSKIDFVLCWSWVVFELVNN